jgi:hypothetical protein
MPNVTLKPRTDVLRRWKQVAEHERIELRAWLQRLAEEAYQRWLVMK